MEFTNIFHDKYLCFALEDHVSLLDFAMTLYVSGIIMQAADFQATQTQPKSFRKSSTSCQHPSQLKIWQKEIKSHILLFKIVLWKLLLVLHVFCYMAVPSLCKVTFTILRNELDMLVCLGGNLVNDGGIFEANHTYNYALFISIIASSTATIYLYLRGNGGSYLQSCNPNKN